ncbi:MAG: tetratricopeptide repeat protein [Ignavibacteriaceae bacterium]|nr:tetratricopeptide repeat protein [Ignavibacteriaceae bacterium]
MKYLKNISFVLSLIVLFSCLGLSQNKSGDLKKEAIQQMKFGRYGEAIDLLNRYISANPQEPEGYNLRGLCYEKRGQYEYAVYDFKSGLKLAPNNKEISENLRRTTESWQALLYNKIEGHKREIAINPNKAVNYLEIGKSYKHLGEWLEAEDWYDEYLKREEASADEIIRYSEILAKNNHISKGEPILKRYCEKYPDDQRLWSRYGYFTLWLGKNKIAIDAFENALRIKPYFKEAMDGLDLARGKGYIYSVNDTTARFNYGLPGSGKEYIIDKYFRMLKSNPGDDATRFSLVRELMKVNRFEEALEQLKILSVRNSENPEFKSLWDDLNNKRIDYYSGRIQEFEKKLSTSPGNREAIMELGKYYSYSNQLDRSTDLFEKYLNDHPEDNEVRFQLALHSAWRNDYCKAMNECDLLLEKDPQNKNYQLLRGQLGVWLNDNLDYSEQLLNSVVSKDPQNLQAILTLASLNLQKENYTSAANYLNTATSINNSNPELINLQQSLDELKKRNDRDELFALVEKARKNLYEKNCDEAIEIFNEYLANPESDQSVRKELADAYICKGDLKNGMKIYDKLLQENYDYQLDLEKAKIYLWQKDSINALREFKRLASKNPDDFETRLYLGDAFLLANQYDNAREVFTELLKVSPNSQIVKTRLNWLGAEGISGISFYTFPAYLLVSPQAFIFDDNIGLNYSQIGLQLEVGITNFLSLGGSAFRGKLKSDIENDNFTLLKGNVILKFAKIFSLNAGFGNSTFSNSINSKISEVSLKAEKEKLYRISAGFISTDAAQMLYSPFLVKKRLQANQLSFVGEYNAPAGVYLSGKYFYYTVPDDKDNKGNSFEFRVGKSFAPDFRAGYEYYFNNWEMQSALYWSPAGFESHSIWSDWTIAKNSEVNFVIGGKVGLIPNENYVLRELYGDIRYVFARSFTVSARLTGSGTVQQKVGYSSLAFQVSAFWSL